MVADGTDASGDLRRTVAALRKAGCIAARDEAVELLAAAGGDRGVFVSWSRAAAPASRSPGS